MPGREIFEETAYMVRCCCLGARKFILFGLKASPRVQFRIAKRYKGRDLMYRRDGVSAAGLHE
jgi:hypothetical protein